jgi:pilus assembly protein CpaB
MAIKLNKNWVMLIASIGIGIVAAYFGNSLVRQRISAIEDEARKGKEMVKVVVPKKDMAKGEALTANMLSLREVPREFMQSNAITQNTLELVENQRLVTPVKRGEMLFVNQTEGVGNKIFSAELRPGRRALTVPVNDENSISGMLRPGDHIDLIVQMKPDNSNRVGAQQEKEIETTFPLMSDVTVLATGTAVTKYDPNHGEQGGQRYSTMTLDVTPQDADRILVAQSAGQLKAVLRHPDDRLANQTASMTSRDLFQHQAAVLPTRSIEMIIGGGSSNSLSIAQAPISNNTR